ncbi:hypothetical protein RND81_02G209500 [Saponaria officinalis]|uniref:Uncharacterized protein n=1 Tax=Saponaria officinalis TaxID=3572 RepID=A0AAW1MN24_SAPOF
MSPENEVAIETQVISAETVGNAFVSQFYQMLHSMPEQVYRFFNDSSTMSRPGPNGDLLTVTTMESIKELILSLNCSKCNAEILTADTQASHMDGVTVLVTGSLTGQDKVRRKFTESFFLAPQENGYFVHNDVFRFIKEDSAPVSDSVDEPCGKPVLSEPSTTVSPVRAVEETVQVADSPLENHNAAPKEDVETAKAPVVQQKPAVIEKALPQPSANVSLDDQPVLEATTNGDKDAPKKSYASLLMNGKQGTSSFPVRVPASPAKPVKPKPAPKPVTPPAQQTQAAASATLPAAAAASESSAPNRSASSNGNASSNGHVAGKGYSIYIGHLPYDATAELVEREFQKFGRIRKNGIQVRSNKGYVFGFIEYEDASAQEKAIEMGTILIGGKDVFIEEKKTSARADDYPSGRGGFRNDGYRRDDGYRRGNFSNGRGYMRNDYGNHHNGEGHFRGNRNGNNGYIHQNGGGRGTRQGNAPPK